MQDLLKEEDFIKKYNPNKLFNFFYVVAVFEIVILFFLSFNDEDLFFAIPLIIAPIATPIIMFFSDKRNIELPINKISFVNLVLSLIYLVGVLLIKLIKAPDSFLKPRIINELTAIFIIAVIYYMICMGIILLYLKIKRDIQKIKTAESK